MIYLLSKTPWQNASLCTVLVGLQLGLLGVLFSPHASAAEVRVTDEVYLQEVGWQRKSDVPLRSLAVVAGQVYAGSEKGLFLLEGDRWLPQQAVTNSLGHLVVKETNLCAISTVGIHRLGPLGWRLIAATGIDAVAWHQGQIFVAQGKRLSQLRGEVLNPLTTNESPFAISHLASHNESLVLQGEGRLTYLNRGRFGGKDSYGFPADQAWDWGDLPSPNVRDLLSFRGSLWVGTDQGLGRLRGMSLTRVDGSAGLPIVDVTCLAAGFTNDLWIGTSRGLIRHVDGAFHYYAGRRWLPHDHVRALAVFGREVFAATDEGLGVIRLEPYTLAKKAAFYEAHLEKWGQKRLGFTHKLEYDEERRAYVREMSDNDGGYSGDYLAAQCYRWAVTQDLVARREATNTFHAFRWMESVTGLPGFPARAMWAKGEVGHKSMIGSGGYPAEWHDTADGRFEWKGDTSSDEICSHFYSVSLFLELAAEGREKEQAVRHLTRMAGHLLEHGWKLVDVDGKPTRWGRWDPDYFNTDEGRHDRGLQALELLSFMKTAAHFSKEARFQEAYDRLVGLGYPEYTLRQRSTFPPEDIAHFEDQLAFWCWRNLLRYETDLGLRALYRRGYERSFEIVRIEQNPWYNLLYASLTGNDGDTLAAVAHLREWPLDLRQWSFQNSQRADHRTPTGYQSFKGGRRAFSPREREPMRWDSWTLAPDGGSGGKSVIEPGGWLLAYWLGRHSGLISGPASHERSQITVRLDEIPEGGAASYDGPPRPAVP